MPKDYLWVLEVVKIKRNTPEIANTPDGLTLSTIYNLCTPTTVLVSICPNGLIPSISVYATSIAYRFSQSARTPATRNATTSPSRDVAGSSPAAEAALPTLTRHAAAQPSFLPYYEVAVEARFEQRSDRSTSRTERPTQSLFSPVPPRATVNYGNDGIETKGKHPVDDAFCYRATSAAFSSSLLRDRYEVYRFNAWAGGFFTLHSDKTGPSFVDVQWSCKSTNISCKLHCHSMF